MAIKEEDYKALLNAQANALGVSKYPVYVVAKCKDVRQFIAVNNILASAHIDFYLRADMVELIDLGKNDKVFSYDTGEYVYTRKVTGKTDER
jgi:hypothetical protein